MTVTLITLLAAVAAVAFAANMASRLNNALQKLDAIEGQVEANYRLLQRDMTPAAIQDALIEALGDEVDEDQLLELAEEMSRIGCSRIIDANLQQNHRIGTALRVLWKQPNGTKKCAAQMIDRQ